MRKTAIYTGIAAAITLIAFLAAIGAMTLLFAPSVDSFAPKTSGDAAAWTQAVAAAIAIFASAWLALYVQGRSERTARTQAAEVAIEISQHAVKVLTEIRRQLGTRQGVYDVATNAVYLDLGASQDLWAMMSEISIQAVRDAGITRELLILRGTVRQFNYNVDNALQHFRSMDTANYDVFFDALRKAVDAAETARENIATFAKAD